MNARWWWCKACDVKWMDDTGVCWACEKTPDEQLASYSRPFLNSQTGSYV